MNRSRGLSTRWLSRSALILALMLTGCEKKDQAIAGVSPTKARSSAAKIASAPLSPLQMSYEKVLGQVVDDDGLVRYAALENPELRKQLDDVVAGFAAETLPSESEAGARMALWLNALNANALKMAFEASRKDGFTSVNDVPGFFTDTRITVAGEQTTLNDLRARLAAFKDPRVHAAIVVGTMTSPALRNECYAADRLDTQLDSQSQRWFDNRGQNRTTPRELLLSPIFEMYAAEFDVEPYRGVLGFVKKHARPGGSLRDFIRGVGGDPPILYMKYDWSLNNTRESASMPASP